MKKVSLSFFCLPGRTGELVYFSKQEKRKREEASPASLPYFILLTSVRSKRFLKVSSAFFSMRET